MAEQLTIGSLFSGIGGIELGLERTGKFKTVWQCEIEPYPSAVLAERWPSVPNLGDITKVRWEHVERTDVVCGGFPCQDISVAGKGRGIVEGKRSGLWSEFARCLREIRPRYALVENVPALADRGLWLVLADLASLGYDAEWSIISAASVGAPHRRERLFIIAHADNDGTHRQEGQEERRRGLPSEPDDAPDASDANARRDELPEEGLRTGGEGVNPHNRRDGVEGRACEPLPRFAEFQIFQGIGRVEDLRGRCDIPEPLLRRTDDGLSSKLDRFKWRERIKGLGNAVVPACAEIAGRRILESEDR